jgi:UDPglucose 6-dehydrogenase
VGGFHLIALGQIYNDVINAELVIIGSDLSYGHNYLKKFYSKIYKKNSERLKFLNLKEAEIAKISINAFITLKISFSNTLSQVADSQDNINVSKIVSVVGSDSRIGRKYLGLGGSYSGPCFPRDSLNFSTYLKKVGAKNYIPIAVEKINQYQIQRYLKLFKKFSKTFKKKPTIGICGITYKKNTIVTDFSPGMQIIKKLINKNKIIIYDEYKVSNSIIKKNKIIYYSNIKNFFNNADVIFVCYVNKKFKDLQNFESKNKKVIIDLWNFLNIKSSKITYKSLGIS